MKRVQFGGVIEEEKATKPCATEGCYRFTDKKCKDCKQWACIDCMKKTRCWFCSKLKYYK